MPKKTSLALVIGFFLLLGTVFSFPQEASAQVAGTGYRTLEKIPFLDDSAGDMGAYFLGAYNLFLIIIVLSAVFMIVIGGFVYLTSGGNTSQVSSAKGIVFNAIIGLILALISWLILNIINPELVGINITGFPPVALSGPAGAGGTSITTATGTPASGSSGNYTGANVGGCTGCVTVSGVSIKPVGQGCKAPGPCKLNSAFLQKLQNIKGQSWLVTEAWPPTVTHSSPCHGNGTCADIHLNSRSTNVTAVKQFYDAIRAAGLNVVYETFANCTPYTAAGVFCKRYQTTTGDHFHVY